MVSERELQVVVPVGFLLAEPQDVSVWVERPGSAPLPIRLRLVPAQVREAVAAALAPAPLPRTWPARTTDFDDGYTELGGGD
jgi:hypothetical protein